MKIFISAKQELNSEYDGEDKKCASDLYVPVLKRPYKNIVLLSGSGTSYGFGVGEVKGMTLWHLQESLKSDLKEDYEKLCKLVRFEEGPGENYETLINRVSSMISFVEGADLQFLEDCLSKIKESITRLCTLILREDAPHPEFLRRLTQRRSDEPLGVIVTLNYDTLFEQAASRIGLSLIDGFSYTSPRIFNPSYFDIDFINREKSKSGHPVYLNKVLQLLKPHGSLSWSKANGRIVMEPNSQPGDLMIYPSSNKFESSYESPYFEMMSRFQALLQRDDTLLITSGFSFGDSHIARYIYNALETNNQLVALCMTYNPDTGVESFPEKLTIKARQLGNLYLANEAFADFCKNYPSNDSYIHPDQDGSI